MGRHSKLTPEKRDHIVSFVRQGLSPERAAQAAGVPRSTFYDWLRRGEGDAENNHPNPETYSIAQLRALAAGQGIDLDTLGPRATRAQIAALVAIPTAYSEFSDAIKRADAEGEAYVLARCIQAGGDDWRMWMTILQRRYGWIVPEAPQEVLPQPSTVDPVAALERGRAILKIIDSAKDGG